MTLQLGRQTPFASGGHRVCYVHPQYPDRVVKVRRPEFTLEDLRRTKKFPKNLRPLAWLDDSREEYAVMRAIDAHLGEAAYAVLSRNYGFEETDFGKGLCSELIRNSDGRVSRTLMQHLWEDGYTPALQQVVADFSRAWVELGIPSRDLLLHNLVVQCAAGEPVRIVAIDGLGSAGMIPHWWLPRVIRQQRARRKIEKLGQLIAEFLETCKTGVLPSTWWILKNDGRTDGEGKQ